MKLSNAYSKKKHIRKRKKGMIKYLHVFTNIFRRVVAFENLPSDTSLSDTSSHNTRNSVFKKRKCNYISDESFQTGGNLANRLMTSQKHIFKVPTGKPRCAIHR